MSTVTDLQTPAPVCDDLDAAPATLDRLHDVGVDLGDVGEVLESSGFPLLVILLDELTTDWSRCSEDVAQWLIVAGVAPDGRVEAIAARYHNQARDGCRDPNNVQQRILEELGLRATWCQGRSEELTADAAQSAALLTEIADGSQPRPTLRVCLPADLATQPEADRSRRRQVYRRTI
jgi:hypothetical protein